MEREKEMFRYAYTQSPYYQAKLSEKELSIDDLMQDWTKIPVVDKRDLICAEESVLPASSCDTFGEDRIYSMFSSGCTGLCIKPVWSQRDLASSKMSLLDYRNKFYNIGDYDKSCSFNIYADKYDNDLIPGRESNGRDLNFSMLNLNSRRVKEIYRIMYQYDPVWIIMPPSVAMIFADYIMQNNLEPIASLRSVELVKEWVSPKQRKYIEEAFHCRTVSLYSSYEMNAIAYECPEGHLHILEENVLVEVMDGDKVLPEGEEGELVFTSLSNTIMPFVRYKIGDRGRISSGECICGCTGKRLELTKAKEDDMIQVENDIDVPAYEFVHAIRRTMNIMELDILQYQVEQTGFLSYIVSIVAKKGEILKNKDLQEKFKQVFRSNIAHDYVRKSIFTFRFRDKLFPVKSSDKLRDFWTFKAEDEE